ncbi:unnamed protein product [Schistosoma mattheei]|uniref:Uncharacterized protein n=1 Tax=Schistosoma mattheei TaxID=31246 RepID=A0A183PZS8_9TREM|nr:unnamed protein product [Schistosoma mattheei]
MPCHGFKFHIPKTHADRIDTETQFDNLFDQIKELHPVSVEKKGWFISKLVDIANQNLVSPTPQSKLLSKDHQTALRNIKRNDDIMILRSDKCSSVVLMNKTDYVSKMKSILNDHIRFKLERSNKDLTNSNEKRITEVLRDLLKKMIDNSTYNNR